ncbi:MAG: hypothetical protein GX168_05200 [Bacteroidales bacterium]|nr:hypothetical protein [Bacteroidales bacterium]
MLVAAAVGGATMAWVTDAAVTEPNKFAAGTVDITAGGEPGGLRCDRGNRV